MGQFPDAGEWPIDAAIIGPVLAYFLTGYLTLLWVAARVFRTGLLLYGQRMSVGSIWRAIKQAG